MQMDNSGIHQPVVDGKDEDLIGRHKELNHDDSTLSLTDILGNSNSDSSLM